MSRQISINALISGIGNLIGRLSGLFREVLLAYFFGTSPLLGYFKYAFSLPNLARRMFGEGALHNAFIPLLAQDKEAKHDDASLFASKICTGFFIFNSFLALIGIALLLLASFFLTPEQQEIVNLGSVMMPYLPMICLAGTLSGILNLYNNFKLPSLMSTSMNCFLIAACLSNFILDLAPKHLLYLLAFALLASGLVQCFILVRASRKHLAIKFILPSKKDSKIKLFLRNFSPVLIGASALQISTYLDKTIALWISPEAVNALSYSELIAFLPVGIIGVSLGSACLPALSTAINQNKDIQAPFNKALSQAFFLSIPCAIIFIFLGRDILSIIYQRGAFDQNSLELTYKAFVLYACGIPFFTSLKVILPIFYAHKNTKTPLRISLWMIVTNLVLGLSLIPWLSYGALAIASATTALGNFFLLLWQAKKLKLINQQKHIAYDFIYTLATSIFAIFCVTQVKSKANNLHMNFLINIIVFSVIYLFFWKIKDFLIKRKRS